VVNSIAATTAHTKRRMVGAVTEHGDHTVAPHGEAITGAAATPVPARTARIFAHTEVVKAHRETVLRHFQRHQLRRTLSEKEKVMGKNWW